MSLSLLQHLRRGGPGLFISGTDTGVGKTWVACRLAEWGRAQGWRMGVLKPAESGAGGDARALIRASGKAWPLGLARPYAFRLPLAPAVAAAAEGRRVRLGPIRKALAAVAAQSDWTLVEGAGGLLVPYAPGLDGAALAAKLGLPVLLVARAGLGTINHSLLSVEAARLRGLRVLGVLLNGKAAAGDPSVETNAAQIRK
ncbi:MAG TPA: dethiobiotin synthase, partial [bacterium]|nr:dethiobiotin synthase [bacterium]